MQKNYAVFKKSSALYARLKMQSNPFDITPLFKNFRDRESCENEEDIFILPPDLNKQVHVLKEMHNKRVLVYGLYGNGKTTFVDFILYLASNFHNRFCSRMIINQDNLRRSINELLTCLCFDIVAEIGRISLRKPLDAILKWFAGKKYRDALMENMLRLIGTYRESRETSEVKQVQKKAGISLGVCQAGIDFAQVTTMRKNIEAYVETLPLKQVTEYLQEFYQIVQYLGYSEILIFLDEADHLPRIDEFLSMLTRAREVLFTRGYSFFVAGSPEIAKYTESLGIIFDKLVFIQPANWSEFLETLQIRLQVQNQRLTVQDVFADDALQFMFESSKGVRKPFLRLAENALDEALVTGGSKVNLLHCQAAQSLLRNEITQTLKDAHMKLLQYLARFGSQSPSSPQMQEAMQVKRSYLRNLLEELTQAGFVLKHQQGRVAHYTISAQYQSYFQNR